MRSVFASLGLAAAACAASPAPRAAAADAQPLDASLAGYVAEAAPARSRTLARAVQPRTIREPSRVEPRPIPRGRRIDVHFADAELGQALALLADAGHFNLVTRDLPPGHVTLALRDVDPYDALLAICRANGVAVRTEGNIVVVAAAK